MSTDSIIRLKKSSVANKVPQSSDLEFGEVALNFTDGKLYFKDSTNVIKFFYTSIEDDALISLDNLQNRDTLVWNSSKGLFENSQITRNLDGGFANSVYLQTQMIDGGSAIG